MNNFEIIAYPLLPIAAMELLLGYLLLSQNPQSSPVHKAVSAIAFFSSAYALNTAVMYLMASQGHDFLFFARLNWIGWFAIPAGLQFLYYLRSEQSRVARMVGYLLYPFWTIVLGICLFTDQIVSPGYSLIPYVNRPGPLEIPARVAGALMIVWSIVEILRAKRHLIGTKKFQLELFFYGLLTFALATVTVAGILPTLSGVGVEPGLGAYFGLPWVVLTFYAIVRHSLFEMRIFFSRTLNILLIILVCSGIQTALLAAIAPAFGTAISSFISLSFLGFFLFGTPASSTLQSLINSLIIGNRSNYETLMREAIVTLNTKQEEHELLDQVIETTCAGLGVRDAGIYFHHVEDGYVMRRGRGRFTTMVDQRSLADSAVNKLRETNQSLVQSALAGEAEDPSTATLTLYMRGIGAEAIIPLLFQGRLQGALVIGPKFQGKPFRQSDVGFLETLAAHAASALENARLNDITRKIRSSLQESEARFMTMAQRIPAAMFINRGTTIVYANTAAAEMTQYSRSQLTTMRMEDIIHPEYRDALQLNGLPRTVLQTHDVEKEVRVVQQSGGERWVVVTSAVIEYGERTAVLWILFDITEHKRSEGKLRYERIRDAVGSMASYVSNDLDRMVKEIRHVAELQELTDDSGHDSELARKITAALERTDILVRTLKEFSARQETNLTLLDIRELVEQREQMLTALLSGKHELTILSSPVPLPALADPIKIERALMNLVINMQEQMPDGGTVAIATGRAAIDAAFIRQHGYGRIGSYAAIAVSNTGQEMDAASRERIFEPFFAARKDAEKRGIGLSMVYDIVKDHEGYITVTNSPGHGCSYTAYLPLVS